MKGSRAKKPQPSPTRDRAKLPDRSLMRSCHFNRETFSRQYISQVRLWYPPIVSVCIPVVEPSVTVPVSLWKSNCYTHPYVVAHAHTRLDIIGQELFVVDVFVVGVVVVVVV